MYTFFFFRENATQHTLTRTRNIFYTLLQLHSLTNWWTLLFGAVISFLCVKEYSKSSLLCWIKFKILAKTSVVSWTFKINILEICVCLPSDPHFYTINEETCINYRNFHSELTFPMDDFMSTRLLKYHLDESSIIIFKSHLKPGCYLIISTFVTPNTLLIYPVYHSSPLYNKKHNRNIVKFMSILLIRRKVFYRHNLSNTSGKKKNQQHIITRH